MLPLFGVVATLVAPLGAADLFVAPDGDDRNRGTKKKPFQSIQRAQEKAKPGDTVYLRGGSYKMSEQQIARFNRIWAYVIHLDKSGRPGKPITYQAAENEHPVFDFSEVKPEGKRVHAFEVTASHIHLKGIAVTGVQITRTDHTQSICFSNTGSHNVYEQLKMHDGMGIGFYLSRGSDNLILNCDAWNNHDPISGDRRGGNVDGFGCHPNRESHTGNVFRGCRAWFNSDDGFDVISAEASIRFENCWAFYNGFSPDFKSLADGNGFKAGGYGIREDARFPRNIPRHVVTHCLAVRNKKNGFYANHHPAGGDWTHNTAYRNDTNFNLLCFDIETRRDVPGTGHVLLNNLGIAGRTEQTNLAPEGNKLAGNIFGQKDYRDQFLSLNEAALTAPRSANGDLPSIPFLQLAPSSDLIDQGVPLDLAFAGGAPDPGAFEAHQGAKETR